MSHIVELNVEITINSGNPDYVLHHVETLITDQKPTDQDLGVMISNEYHFIKELLGFKPYCVKIETGSAGKIFFK